MLLLGVSSLLWFIFRTGTKPSRITYPCQRAAAANVHVFLLAFFAPLLGFTKFKAKVPRVFNHRFAVAILLLSSLLLAFGSVSFTGNCLPSSRNYLHVPLELEPHEAVTSDASSNLFFIENASGVEGNMDEAISALFRLMEVQGASFFKTASQPAGLIGKDDVLIIEVNCQWSQRGGTSTDLVKSLIQKIVNHPEGFTGEIVVADNGQGYGSLNWWRSNAFNHSQSMQDVVNMFPSYKVSTWLWDRIRRVTVNEYDQGDLDDGYVVNSTMNRNTRLYVSYPKFKTMYGTHISFKKGIWEGGSYNSEKLKVINVPVLKSHWVYGVTACVKNYMGVVSNNLPTYLHAHWSVALGGMGTEMAETRFPILNILDCIWVNAIPMGGPATSYGDASFTNVIGASQDPVALEYWASKHILIPAAIHKGYTEYSSLDPDYEPITPGLDESYHNYLERSMNALKNSGHEVTMNETEMNVYVSPARIPATVNIDPDTLNLRSKGKWITSYIELPESHNVSDIDVYTVVLNDTIPVSLLDVPTLEPVPTEIGDYDEDGVFDLMVKFDKAFVESFIYNQGITYGEVSLTITGELFDETPFKGTDIVWVNYAGDVNNDGIVNILDAAMVSAHWHPGPPTGPLGYDSSCDFNKDGAVNILDAAILSVNWDWRKKVP